MGRKLRRRFSFSASSIKTIEEAKGILDKRARDVAKQKEVEEAHKKEEKDAPGSAQKTAKPSTMQDFLSQKKQMFLVELANTCLKQEIVNLERKTEERQMSLQ